MTCTKHAFISYRNCYDCVHGIKHTHERSKVYPQMERQGNKMVTIPLHMAEDISLMLHRVDNEYELNDTQEAAWTYLTNQIQKYYK